MSNNNQIPVNMGNIPIQSNPMNTINQMNLVFLNNNLANLNIQNNIQMNQNFIFNKLIVSMDNFDIYTFQTLLSEHQFNTQTKNILLNKSILLYLSHFNQAKAQYALKQMITILLKLKANPNLRLRYINSQNNINNNNYAIFPIAEKNDIELVKIFLDNNADINVLDSQGRNCLYYLMTIPFNENNFIDRRPLCSLLLGRGIKINILDNNGISPMMESINKGYIYIMNMLIKYGGNVNLVNFSDGNTALHYAIMNKNKHALFILLGKGNCDFNIKNKNGENGIDLANKLDSVSDKEIYELVMKYINPEKEKNEEENGKNKNKKDKNANGENSGADNDKMFVFPTEEITSRVEIPFAFQNNNPILNYNDSDSSTSNNTSNNNLNNLNHFYSFIKIQNTPTLYLDISNEASKEKLMYDSLINENQNLVTTLEQKESKLHNFKNENELLKNELLKLKNELDQRKAQIKKISEQKKAEEEKHFQQMKMGQTQIEQKDRAIQSLLVKYKNLENQLKNEKKSEGAKSVEEITKESEESTKDDETKSINSADKEKLKYLEKKFNDEKYNDVEVINLITTDLYDLYHYNRIVYESRIQEINKMINMLKGMIDIDVEIKLYGSYATKSSLSWSEVDLLIIPSKNPNYVDENFYMNFIKNLFQKLQNEIYGKVMVLENTHIITPIIKVETNENNNNMSLIYNIYTLDNLNYGEELKNANDNSLLNSIIMTNYYNNKYKGKFIPLLLAIKQLLFNANLINNYYNNSELNITFSGGGGISSYALNVMLMSFLDQYSPHTNDIPLGQIFVDFLKIHGYLMNENNNRKIIYLDYNNNGHNDKNEDIKFFNENSNIETMRIIDPFNVHNNLFGNSYGFNQIKTAFMIAFSVIKDNCECSCHYDEAVNYQGKTHCILNKIFKTVKRFTNKRKSQ